ncbi:protein SET-like [Toxorhynchites rutilus septentrionalis]|uniref:protein SET-like n=1 Tax=Toxorhynchites rutilus septentrionalis TaxID=329112 RepID=UPI002479FB29|nr:protein SET-like [Toxorhynchites rutilus septentrionalis]XP_055627968.1 protein SET-like [Toxorhynchites rutilus septentrionalis]XP_055627969.1 protein SET-like [Toxorhynchites rutilus septentrionalis]
MPPNVDKRFVLEEFAICSRRIEQLYGKSNGQFLEAQFRERNNIIKSIPNFWQTVISNHPLISAISDAGEDVHLQFMNDLGVDEFSVGGVAGYRLHFHFDLNPFFADEVLTKEFITLTNGDNLTTSTDTQWNPMLEGTELQPSRKRFREIRTFLDWFMENDDSFIDIAKRIRSDLWVNAFTYYMISQNNGAVTVESNGDERGPDPQVVTMEPTKHEESRSIPEKEIVEKTSTRVRRSTRLQSKPRINWRIRASI